MIISQRLLYIFFLLVAGYAVQAQILSGTVTDELGEPLVGANVFVSGTNTGVTTNAYGYYTLSLQGGNIQVVCSYVGYRSDTLRIQAVPPAEHHFRLSFLSMKEVVVSATRSERNAQTGVVNLPIRQIKKIPTLGGEVDVIKALSFTPGVNNGSEGSAGLYVRGGTPDQNLILLDDAVVYNPNHLFGFVSVFNPDAIKDITLIKGNFPARYGGRLSSVLDIRMKEGNTTRHQAEGGIGLLASRLTMDGPLVKNKVSYMFAARASYLGLLASPIRWSYNAGKIDQFINYHLADLNGKITWKINETDRLSFSVYSGDDHFRILNQTFPSSENKAGIRWGNMTATLRYAASPKPGLFWETTAGYSRFGYRFLLEGYEKYQNGDFYRSRYQYFSGLQDFFAKTKWSWSAWKHHTVRAGAELTMHHFTPRAAQLYTEDSGEKKTSDTSERSQGLSAALFVEDEWQISPALAVQPGLRWSLFSIGGKNYTLWEPRFGLHLKTGAYSDFKAGYSRTQQFIHLLTGSNQGLQNDLWVPASQDVPPQTAEQFAIGWSRFFPKLDLEAGAELYYKKMRDLIEYAEGVNIAFTLNNDLKDIVEKEGRGRSYGFELFLQKSVGKTTGLLAYTLSRTDRRFERINNGAGYPFKYDAPHRFTLTLNHQLSAKWDFSFTWVYQSGFPFSFPESMIPNPNAPNNLDFAFFLYRRKNNERLPPYHRADIGFNKTTIGRFGGQRTWSFSLYNAYNRQNVLYAHYVNNRRYDPATGGFITERKIESRSLLPIIPSVSYSVRFGQRKKE